MLFDLLPDSLGRDITVESVDRFASGIRDLPVNPGSSFLVQRVLRGLEHFTVRRSASEVSTVLASQSELDSNAVSSSYALLNVFIWAIPILGFIGTVQGLGMGRRESVGQPQGGHRHRKRQDGAGRDHGRLGRRVRYDVGGADHGPVFEISGQFAAKGRGRPAELGG